MAAAAPLVFDQSLHQSLPNPLAGAYRKAFNSPTPKELHDNACLFGLGLLRFMAFIGIALVRELRPTLTAEETALLDKLDRPSEGDWLAWLNRAVGRVRESKPLTGSLGAALDIFWRQRCEAARSSVPAALETLLQHLEKKIVVRRQAEVPEFFLTLVRYRNDTIGHGAALPDEKNQAHGEAILRAAGELAATLPLTDWQLKHVVGSSLGPTSVECQMIDLTGPQWLREPPVSYPRGYPAPLAEHAILLPRQGGEHLDLHPLMVFRNQQAVVFNGLKGKSPTYLQYDSGLKLSLEALATDYREWKQHFGSDSGQGQSPESLAVASDTAEGVAAERFHFDHVVGRGGMGEVWSAYDNALKRQVAIKRVRPELLGRGEFEQRFLHEARDAARLNHPNIVPILSIESDNQGTFLVLEFLDGGNLRQLLTRGPLPLPLALAYLRQLLQALDHAHQHGLIHRDVKPENILLTKAGVPKLADFGLAWLLEQADEPEAGEAGSADETSPADISEARVAKAGEGTKNYLAPELRDGSAAPSPLTDLYALGITFYEMLTGRPPQRVDEKHVPSTALALLRKLVHPDANFRYPSAQAAVHECLELERALEMAGRTREETAARIQRTIEQSYQLLTEERVIDAQAGLERIVAEDPNNAPALTGLLLIQLSSGEMEAAARRYRALTAAGCDDPVFRRLKALFDAIPSPTILYLTPQALPFSYRIDDLRAGRLSKELIELAANTANLGDVGESLIELCQNRPGGRWECSRCDAEQLQLQFDLVGLRVQADFRYRIKPAAWFSGPRLLAADLTLTISGESLEIYRLARYVGSQLSSRFKRPPADWVRPPAAAIFGHDAAAARRQWQQLCGRIVPQILAAASASGG